MTAIARRFGAVFLLAAAAAAPVQAEDGRLTASKEPVTGEGLQSQLLKMELRLAVIEENQKKILQGQEKLSQEHEQLRYWVHRA